MKLLTVATHSQNMFPFLKHSCERFGHELVILGWGEAYQSHHWKDDLVLQAISNLDDDEVVCFVDGFDSMICATPDELLAEFKSMDTDFVMSVDGHFKELRWTHNPLWCYVYMRCFPTVEGYCVNTGMYIGTVRRVKAWIESVKTHRANTKSNQLAWIRCMKHSPKSMWPTLDTKRRLFYNHMEVFSSDTAIQARPDGTIVGHKTGRILVISLPGFRDATPVLREIYGHDVSVPVTSSQWSTGKKIAYYLRPLQYEICVILLILACVIASCVRRHFHS